MKHLQISLAGINRLRSVTLASVLLVVLALLLSPTPAGADVGPKPEMTFRFDFQTVPVDIVEGQLLECETPACTAAEPLMEVGPQRFTCAEHGCYSMAYGYAPYHRLALTFADGSTRESNVFEKKAFNSLYIVTVTDSDLKVKEVVGRSESEQIVPAVVVTILVEMLLAFVYLLIFRRPKRVLIWVLVANIISLPVVWFLFPLLPLPLSLVLFLAEIFAFLFEAVFLYLTNRQALGLKHALALSFVTNLASFLIGLAFVGF